MRRGSVAIIVCDKKLLFFKRDDIPTISEPGKWQFPGGHIEKGETPIEAVKRELVEEVSYSPPNLTFVGKLRDSSREVNVFWCYVDKEEADKFKLGELEGQEIRFMSVDEALKQNLTKNVGFYISTFKDLISKHLDKKTIPNVKEFLQIGYWKFSCLLCVDSGYLSSLAQSVFRKTCYHLGKFFIVTSDLRLRGSQQNIRG